MDHSPHSTDDAFDFAADYETLESLGRGQTSEVFKARRRRDGQLFAIKKSLKQLHSRKHREQFLGEIEASMSSTDGLCPSIIRYYRAWQDDGYFFLQTELCEKGNLKDLVRSSGSSTVSEEFIWRLVGEIGGALGYLHSHGICHLDVKTENILVTASNQLKLGDLSLARRCGSEVDGWEGDNRYMAPELLASPRKMPPADVFSFGMVVWELASGDDLPMEGQLWQNLRSDFTPNLKNISPQLNELLRQMLRSDPAERVTMNAILGEGNPIHVKLLMLVR
jgi:membrane-associated tyrosine/threonine-specific cdc2-inhibitory kinase